MAEIIAHKLKNGRKYTYPDKDGTFAMLDDISGGSIPSGLISMWHGLLSAIPAGWVLCDGTNGTPDLRDKFVRGASTGNNPGGTGGANTHTHTYSDVINHTHPVSITDPGHTHVQGVNSAATGGTSGYTADTSTNTRVNSGYSTSSATTGISATTSNPVQGMAEGQTFPASSLPAYYAIAFIMKT